MISNVLIILMIYKKHVATLLSAITYQPQTPNAITIEISRHPRYPSLAPHALAFLGPGPPEAFWNAVHTSTLTAAKWFFPLLGW